jgi:formiminotetrahydrofolate cyclodeaminase
MTLSGIPLAELLAAVRAPTPTPGGGSASAVAGALGASLLTMVASMPKHRAGSEEDAIRLQAAGRRCARLSERLTALIDRDSEAYDMVLAAYRLPKASEPEKSERSARIQDAIRAAVAAPLEVMRASAEAIEAAAVVAAFGNPHAASDVGVALEVLSAALRGARLNVEINLASMKDGTYAADVRHEIETLTLAAETGVATARRRLPGATG